MRARWSVILMLLVLALAPGLTAGGKLSRTLATAAGAFAVSTTLVPASAADLAAADPASASGLPTPYGLVRFKPMSHLCPGPTLDPRTGSDLELVEALVMEALESGARDFIVRPFKPDHVLEVAQKALSKSDD